MKLISRKTAEDMVRGSLERTVGQVREAVAASDLFGQPGTARHVATHAGHAIVGTPEGKFYKVRFESTGDGVKLGTPEAYPVEVVDEAEVARRKAADVVEGLLRGERLTAEKLAEVAEAVPAGMVRPQEAVRGLLAALEDASRPWRKALRENATRLRRFLEAEMPSIRARLPRSTNKFAPLYSGGSQVEAADYAQAVRACLRTQAERLESMADSVDDALSAACARDAKYMSPEEGAAFESSKGFAKDFVEDVGGVSTALSGLIESSGSASELGLACDRVVERMEEFELAAAFAAKALGAKERS